MKGQALRANEAADLIDTSTKNLGGLQAQRAAGNANFTNLAF